LTVGNVPSLYFYDSPTLTETILRAEQQDFVPDIDWAREKGIKVVPMPHTSGLAWNRPAPSFNNQRWSVIGEQQIRIAVDLSRNCSEA
jgi:hypothetical protein